MSTEVQLHQSKKLLDVWGDDFEAAQRRAQALVASVIFPTQYKDIGSCLIILDMAQRLDMSPLEVAQNIHIIHGKPSWQSTYLIDKVTSSPLWKDVDYETRVDGKISLPNNGGSIDNVVGWYSATRAKDGKRITGNEVSYRMAVAEGWWTRKDSKWPNMPRQMLQYRAMSFFNRANPTTQTFGIRSVDEQEDILDTTATVISSTPRTTPKAVPKTQPVQDVPQPDPKTAGKSAGNGVTNDDQGEAKVLVGTVEVVNVPAANLEAKNETADPAQNAAEEEGEEGW